MTAHRLYTVCLFYLPLVCFAQAPNDSFESAYESYERWFELLEPPWANFSSCPLAPNLLPQIRGPDACASEGGGFLARRGANNRHFAIDIEPTISGAAVNAISDGEVGLVGEWPNLGRFVILEHDNGIYSLYGHLQSYSVRIGEQVSAGTKLGIVGYSGNSSCLQRANLVPHLHFAVYRGTEGDATFPKRIGLWMAYKDEMKAREANKPWGPLNPKEWLENNGCVHTWPPKPPTLIRIE